jgi:hypothetical protein
MWMPRRRTLLALASLALAFAVCRRSAAQRAAYATPDELHAEGLSHLADVAMLGEYARVARPEAANGVRDIVDFALRSRMYLGRFPSYCVGLDGSVGGSNAGVAYGVTGYLTGIGARFGSGNVVSLCGGAGLDAVGSNVPLAARFPAELSVALSLGPLRPTVWLRPAWVRGAKAREGGASVSFVDELEAGALVRIGRQHPYWARMSAGGGVAIGVAYRELMGTYAVLGTLGFEFTGEQ